jgi:hypothetical protein
MSKNPVMLPYLPILLNPMSDFDDVLHQNLICSKNMNLRFNIWTGNLVTTYRQGEHRVKISARTQTVLPDVSRGFPPFIQVNHGTVPRLVTTDLFWITTNSFIIRRYVKMEDTKAYEEEEV